MKRFDLKDVPKEVEAIKKQLANGWKASAYVDGDKVFEVDITKKTDTGLMGGSYMICEWTPRALKKMAEEIGAKRITA